MASSTRSQRARVADERQTPRRHRVGVSALVALLSVVLIGCTGGDGDDSANGAQGEAVASAGSATDETDAATDDTAIDADTGETGDASGGDGQDAPADGTVGCEVSGDRSIDVLYTNPGPDPVDLVGDIEGTVTGAGSGSTQSRIRAIVQGETVQQTFLVTVGESTDPLDACSVDMRTEPAEPTDPAWTADVSECMNLREGEFGTFTFDLSATNNSTAVPAYYAIEVAVRDPEGRRLASAFTLAKEQTAELAPGETYDWTVTTLGAPYVEGATCDVATVQRNTSVEILAEVDGALTGRLEADLAFVSGSADLTADALTLLARFVESTASHSGEICVEGYADSVGGDAENLELSQARAEAVMAQLMKLGVDNEITAIGYGESEATEDEVDDAALRRVDIVLAACSP